MDDKPDEIAYQPFQISQSNLEDLQHENQSNKGTIEEEESPHMYVPNLNSTEI
jgi:hypothetical protein